MNRRDFLRSAGIASAGLAIPGKARLFVESSTPSRWRTFEVTTRVEVLASSGATRVWLPAALIAGTPFQRTIGNRFHADGGSAKMIESKADAMGIIAAEFPAGVKPILTLTSRIATRDYSVDFSAPGKAPRADSAELRYFLRPTKLLPTDGIVKATAAEITSGAHTRRRESPGDLRLDRREYVSGSEDARLWRWRHPLHVGVKRSGRQVRRSQRALRWTRARRGPSRSRCLWHPRCKIGARVQEPRHLTGKRRRKRSTAARKCTSTATAGSRSIRRTCAKWRSRSLLEIARSMMTL